MRQERTDADHLGAEFLDEDKVFHQMVDGLSRTAHHDAGSHLVADALQVVQAAQPVVEGEGCRMQLAVVVGVVGFVAQQVAVGTCAEEAFVGFGGFFSQRQRDGCIGEGVTDVGHQLFHTFVGQIGVLTALKDKRAES